MFVKFVVCVICSGHFHELMTRSEESYQGCFSRVLYININSGAASARVDMLSHK
jgi:hypothetical protein